MWSPVKADRHRCWAILGWVAFSLALAQFHEPWRDEAQAWLVATSSSSFGELLFRSAVEGTGPVYYLILWPFARLFPGAFPILPFLLSWLGTFAAIVTLLTWETVPLRIGLLIAFGYLFGYEYASVARLYGWGCFFVLLGFRADLKNQKPLAIAALSLACLTQLNFLFATLGWILFRSETRKKLASHWPVGVAAVASLVHLQSVSSYSQWNAWALYPQYITRLGILLSTPFVHMHGAIGWGGLILFPLALLPLSKRARLALVASLTPYVLLFLLRYPGHPRTRHAGGIFILWIVLLMLSDWSKKKSGRSAVYFFLGVSFVIGIGSMIREIGQPFSHGLAAAKAIESKGDSRPIRLFNSDPLYGTVVAARLNVPLWTHAGPRGCPFFPGKCPDTLVIKSVEPAFQCGETNACFFVSHQSQPPFPAGEGKWNEIFRGAGSIVNEDLAVYEWRAN